MIRKGAFCHGQPELYEFDQFLDNKEFFRDMLQTDRIDIIIDDGFHSNESILKTMSSVFPYLAEEFVYACENSIAGLILDEFVYKSIST